MDRREMPDRRSWDTNMDGDVTLTLAMAMTVTVTGDGDGDVDDNIHNIDGDSNI